MKIAIPVQNNLLCQHFGHCEQFYICNVDGNNKIAELRACNSASPRAGTFAKMVRRKAGKCNNYRRNGPKGSKSICTKKYKGMCRCTIPKSNRFS